MSNHSQHPGRRDSASDSRDDSFLGDIVADNPGSRPLAAALSAWRNTAKPGPVTPDGRLEAIFSKEPTVNEPARSWQWLRRPVVVFAASFTAVLVVGAGAFALVARDSSPDIVATPTSSTSALAATDVAADDSAQIILPDDLTDQTGYATCVLGELAGWFEADFAPEESPDLLGECGTPPIPDLGPEAEAYRQELQAWANCIATETQSLLPTLLSGLGDGAGDIEDECGPPPDPGDFGLELPFIEFAWEDFDPSQFGFGPFNFGRFDGFEHFDLEDFDLDKLLEGLPDGLIPEDFNLEDFDLDELRRRFEAFDFEGFDLEGFDFGEFNFGDFNFEGFDFEGCLPAEGTLDESPHIDSLEDLDSFDFGALFGHLEGCDFSTFLPGDFESLDLENFFADLFGQDS